MRLIGTIQNSQDAEHFSNHLRAIEIACSVDRSNEGFRIWVFDDDLVAKAKTELSQFLADPNDPRFQDSDRRAVIKLREGAARLKAARQRTVNLADRWNRPAVNAIPVTIGLIGLSLLVAIRTMLVPDLNDDSVKLILFSEDASVHQILSGQVWRIISPIFLHFGPMHFLFNMAMLYQFGLLIEPRMGPVKFLPTVLVIAAVSNYFQFLFGGPAFGGMSGVVYGLFGYCWIKGHMEPQSGLSLPQQTIVFMLVWHGLCLVGIIPNVANWAHQMGLVAGMAIAAIGSLSSSRKFPL